MSWPELKRLQKALLDRVRAPGDEMPPAECARRAREVVGPIPDGDYLLEVVWNLESIPYHVRVRWPTGYVTHERLVAKRESVEVHDHGSAYTVDTARYLTRFRVECPVRGRGEVEVDLSEVWVTRARAESAARLR